MGLHLGGGKGDRTSLVVIDYYESQEKLFLTQIYEHIQSEGELSSDQVLYEIINEHVNEGVESLSIDVPLKFPKCVTCKLLCPGYENCKEKEIVWMWRQYKSKKQSKPKSKIFTPYTQRVVEFYINTFEGEHLPQLETFGANTAPLTVRGNFLQKRFNKKLKMVEVLPALSVYKTAQYMKLSKNQYVHYKHQVGGEEARQAILDGLVKKDIVFVYQQDYHRLIHNIDTFEAFFTAFTGFLKYKKLCVEPPKDIPLKQGWIYFPVKNLGF